MLFVGQNPPMPPSSTTSAVMYFAEEKPNSASFGLVKRCWFCSEAMYAVQGMASVAKRSGWSFPRTSEAHMFVMSDWMVVEDAAWPAAVAWLRQNVQVALSMPP